jgi:hypothetical protein
MERRGSAGPSKAVASELEVVRANDHTLIIQELSTVIDREGVAV